jgi:hypothetical protein
MKETDIPKLGELIINLATGFCELTPDDLKNPSSRAPAHVAARRVCVYALKEKLGLKTKHVVTALQSIKLNDATVYNMAGYGKDIYGKSGKEAESFTLGIDRIYKEVISKFGTVEEIQAAFEDHTQPPAEPAGPKARRPVTARAKAKGPVRKKPEPVATTEKDNDVEKLLLTYALSKTPGATPKLISEALGISIEGIELSVGRTVLSQDQYVIEMRTGIDDFYVKLKAATADPKKK